MCPTRAKNLFDYRIICFSRAKQTDVLVAHNSLAESHDLATQAACMRSRMLPFYQKSRLCMLYGFELRLQIFSTDLHRDAKEP